MRLPSTRLSEARQTVETAEIEIVNRNDPE